MAYINYLKLIISIFICELAGIIGGFFTASSVLTWYQTLNKPFFNPPNWLFGPVWIVLYFLMGFSLYLIWNNWRKNKTYRLAIIIFIIQLILNLLWSILFFGLKIPLLGFIEIIFLWFAILFTIIYFYKISKISAYLLIPYIIWVSFASILNLFIYILN
jgi:translocator protein